jgi:hypothetical protein
MILKQQKSWSRSHLCQEIKRFSGDERTESFSRTTTT